MSPAPPPLDVRVVPLVAPKEAVTDSRVPLEFVSKLASVLVSAVRRAPFHQPAAYLLSPSTLTPIPQEVALFQLSVINGVPEVAAVYAKSNLSSMLVRPLPSVRFPLLAVYCIVWPPDSLYVTVSPFSPAVGLVSNEVHSKVPSSTVKAFATVLKEIAARSAVNSCLGRCSFMFDAGEEWLGDDGWCVEN